MAVETVPGFRTFRLVAVSVCGIMSLVFNAFNSLVLWNHQCGFKQVNRLLLRVLAAVDFFTGLLVINLEYMYVLSDIPEHWDGFCRYIYPWLFFFSFMSMFLIGLVSLDRFIAIRYPLRYPIIIQRRHVYGAIIVITLLSFFETVSTCWGTTPFDALNFNNETRYCRVQFGTYSHTTIFGLGVAIPTLVGVFFVNSSLLRKIIEHKRRRRHLLSQQGVKQESAAVPLTRIISTPDLKTIRIFIVINVAYYICWLPAVVEIANYWIDKDREVSEVAEFFVYFPAYSNSWVNAVVYLFMYTEYRKVAKYYLSGGTRTARYTGHVDQIIAVGQAGLK